jgi:digeranylgeranylglycerophospholipid reductase
MEEGVSYVLFDREYAPGGYFYMGKLFNGEGIACVVLDGSMMKQTPKEYFKKFIEQNKTVKQILHSSKTKSIISGRGIAGSIERRVKGNLILVGEAARTLDPLLGYGMKNSILSAYISCELISESLKKNNLKILEEYDNRLLPILSNVSNGFLYRKIFNKLDNNDLDNIINFLSELQKDGINLDKVFQEKKFLLIKQILKKVPMLSRIIIKTLF